VRLTGLGEQTRANEVRRRGYRSAYY